MPTEDHIVVPLNLLLVEDEEEILSDMRFELEEWLAGLSEAQNKMLIEGDSGAPAPVVIKTALRCSDNLRDARQIIHSGNCDVLMADYKVKENPGAAKGTASMLPLLSEIRNRRAFIPVIGHTAFRDMLDRATVDGLADDTISKQEPNSRQLFLNRGETATKEMLNYKRHLWEAFAALKCAAYHASPIEKQTALGIARKLFANLQPPQRAPLDYRKAFVLLAPCILRISSVPSLRFRIGQVSPDLVDTLEHLIQELAKPLFSYQRDALPVFMALDAKGYDVVMRIVDDAE